MDERGEEAKRPDEEYSEERFEELARFLFSRTDLLLLNRPENSDTDLAVQALNNAVRVLLGQVRAYREWGQRARPRRRVGHAHHHRAAMATPSRLPHRLGMGVSPAEQRGDAAPRTGGDVSTLKHQALAAFQPGGTAAERHPRSGGLAPARVAEQTYRVLGGHRLPDRLAHRPHRRRPHQLRALRQRHTCRSTVLPCRQAPGATTPGRAPRPRRLRCRCSAATFPPA